MEQYWLADTDFVAGKEISIADLLYSCELDEMRLMDSLPEVCPSAWLLVLCNCECCDIVLCCNRNATRMCNPHWSWPNELKHLWQILAW